MQRWSEWSNSSRKLKIYEELEDLCQNVKYWVVFGFQTRTQTRSRRSIFVGTRMYFLAPLIFGVFHRIRWIWEFQTILNRKMPRQIFLMMIVSKIYIFLVKDAEKILFWGSSCFGPKIGYFWHCNVNSFIAF